MLYTHLTVLSLSKHEIIKNFKHRLTDNTKQRLTTVG